MQIPKILTGVIIMPDTPTYEKLEQRIRDLEKAESGLREAEKALKKSEALLIETQSLTKLGGWELDVSTGHMTWTDEVYRIYGLEADEYDPDDISRNMSFYAPKAIPVLRQAFDHALNRGEPYDLELEFTRANGERIWVRTIGRPEIRDGKVLRISGNIMEISARKRAEEALRESELRYRMLFDMAGDAIFVAKGDRFFDCNNEALKIFRCTRDQILDHTPYDFSPPTQPDGRNSRTEALSRINRAAGGEPQVFEWTHRHADGTPFDAEVSVKAVTFRDETLLQIIVRDITRRKETEQALRDSEERFRLLHQASVGAIGIHDMGILRDVNQAAVDLTGYAYDELVGMDGLMLIAPEWRSKVRENIVSGYEKPYEVVGLRKDGSTYPLEIQGKQIPFEGRTLRVTEFRDITWRRQTARSLRESEEKYRLVVENANDAIFIAQDDSIKFPNPKAIEIIGYTEEELAHISLSELIHPDDREMVVERHHGRLGGRNPPMAYEFRVVSKAGNTIPVSLSVVSITWEGRPATLSFLRDMTQQKEWDDKAHHIQRMEAIGTLAGGIAHNFNNTLMGIQGRASLMILGKDTSHPDYEHLKGIEAYVKTAAELTKDLLGFAKGGKYEVRPIDLNVLIRHECRMFAQTKREIKVREKYERKLWAVDADKGQISQSLMNLYVNAWQAMPSGGELYIQTENVIVGEDYVRAFKVAPGRYVKVSVTDTGVGMDEATQERIFDPFFTTRDMGTGTGLGLSSVYGIVKNHGGFINVYSEAGQGSTFNIYLPASEKEAAEVKEPSEDVVRGEGTVLLVDDEKIILEVGKLLLEKLGYRVLMAKSGKDAVDIYSRRSAGIDLVILDMIMPDMSGGETYDRLRQVNPDIKVILSSGYSLNGQAQKILDRGCNGFIQKPFTMKEVSQKIHGLLQRGDYGPGDHPSST